MAIPVSQIVQVTISTTPTLASVQNTSTLLLIGDSSILPIGDRIRTYSSATGLAADFGTTPQEYVAGNIYFSQSPAPKQLKVARWFRTAVPAELLGGSPATLSAFNAITAGTLTITIDGSVRNLTGLNFSADTSLTAVAAKIQTALTAANGTCTFELGKFVFRSPTTGASSSISYASGTVAALVAGTLATGAVLTANGLAAESVADVITNLAQKDPNFYSVAFALATALTQTENETASSTVESMPRMFFFTSSDSGILSSSTTTDIASVLKGLARKRTAGMYDSNDPYAAVSMAARLMTVNYFEQNSALTLKFKKLPGITAESLTDTQRGVLDTKRINYYTTFGTFDMIAEGVTPSGDFIDQTHALDFMRSLIETEVFNLLAGSFSKIPQTDQGMTRVQGAIDKALSTCVSAGILGPGRWSGETVGEIKSGDLLSRGFYIHIPSVSTLTTAQRQARQSPAIKVIALGAGALHSVAISVLFTP